MKKVGILMGSDSDLPVVEKAIEVLKGYEVPIEVHVYSAHRTPRQAEDFAINARKNTTLPVIGLPCSSKVLDGLDALLATVMMPPGVPVATVGIDTAKNAALLAIEILAVEDEVLAEKLLTERENNRKNILNKNKAIEEKYNN